MPLAAVQAEYDEWFDAATKEDKRSGALRWKEEDRSNRYDFRVVRERGMQDALQERQRRFG